MMFYFLEKEIWILYCLFSKKREGTHIWAVQTKQPAIWYDWTQISSHLTAQILWSCL